MIKRWNDGKSQSFKTIIPFKPLPILHHNSTCKANVVDEADIEEDNVMVEEAEVTEGFLAEIG